MTSPPGLARYIKNSKLTPLALNVLSAYTSNFRVCFMLDRTIDVFGDKRDIRRRNGSR